MLIVCNEGKIEEWGWHGRVEGRCKVVQSKEDVEYMFYFKLILLRR